MEIHTDSVVTGVELLPPPCPALLNKSGFRVKLGDSEELLFPGETEAG